MSKTITKTTKKTKTRKPITFSADGIVTLDCTFELTITDPTYRVADLADDIDAGRITTEDVMCYPEPEKTALVFKPEDGEARRIGWVSFGLCNPEWDCLQNAGLYNFFKMA